MHAEGSIRRFQTYGRNWQNWIPCQFSELPSTPKTYTHSSSTSLRINILKSSTRGFNYVDSYTIWAIRNRGGSMFHLHFRWVSRMLLGILCSLSPIQMEWKLFRPLQVTNVSWVRRTCKTSKQRSTYLPAVPIRLTSSGQGHIWSGSPLFLPFWAQFQTRLGI